MTQTIFKFIFINLLPLIQFATCLSSRVLRCGAEDRNRNPVCGPKPKKLHLRCFLHLVSRLFCEFTTQVMSAGGGNQLISVLPEELRFQFELEKQSFCDLKVINNTENHVAFKVKTTSPKKYFVRPNTGVIQAWDSCVIRVTLQAQREYPPDMQCKDKFLLQSTIVPPNSDVDELPQDTFTKESGRTIEECKLRVVYLTPGSGQGNEDGASMRGVDTNSNQAFQRLKEERDSVVRQTQTLQQELHSPLMVHPCSLHDVLKRRRYRKGDPGFSFTFAIFVGLIGLMVGFLLNLSLSSPPIDASPITEASPIMDSPLMQ